MNIRPEPIPPKELLARLKRQRIRRVAQRSDDASEALFHLAAAGRKDWTGPEWEDVLSELDRCDDTVEDWLAINT